MNLIRKSLDSIKKPFGKGQKLEKFAPAINAFDTFLFVPNHTTKKGAHIRDAIDLKRTMVTVIIALLPALLYGIYNTGYQYLIQTGSPFTFLEAISNLREMTSSRVKALNIDSNCEFILPSDFNFLDRL